MIIQAFLYDGGIFTSANAGYYILNSLAFLMVAMSIAYLAGTLAGGMAALNGINNVISLGMCFLGGILAPIEMLNAKVENVSRFLPTYWYAKINGILSDYADISPKLMQTVRNGLRMRILDLSKMKENRLFDAASIPVACNI